MGKLTNILSYSALFLGLAVSCNELNQLNKNTYEVKILDKTRYQTLFGKVREEYAVKLKNKARVDLFDNGNVLFYKQNASEISKKLKIGKTYKITVNGGLLANFNPNIVSVEDAK